jgi:hypothetical protein
MGRRDRDAVEMLLMVGGEYLGWLHLEHDTKRRPVAPQSHRPWVDFMNDLRRTSRGGSLILQADTHASSSARPGQISRVQVTRVHLTLHHDCEHTVETQGCDSRREIDPSKGLRVDRSRNVVIQAGEGASSLV